jgi:hypothetical protein
MVTLPPMTSGGEVRRAQPHVGLPLRQHPASFCQVPNVKLTRDCRLAYDYYIPYVGNRTDYVGSSIANFRHLRKNVDFSFGLSVRQAAFRGQ